MMWKVGSGQKCQAGTNGIAESRLLKGDFSPSWSSIWPAFGRGADLNFRERDAFGQLDGLKGDVHDAVMGSGWRAPTARSLGLRQIGSYGVH
jgi:hypothetical protein